MEVKRTQQDIKIKHLLFICFDMYTSHKEEPPSSLLKYINRSECIKTIHTEEKTEHKSIFKTP